MSLTTPQFVNQNGDLVDVLKRIGTRLYCIVIKRSDANCRFCGRESTVYMGDPRSYGFRSKAHHSHVGSCYDKALASLGYETGKYVERHMLHRAEPVTPKPFKAASAAKVRLT